MSTESSSGPIAILLCAGYGTRMGALTAETPKPLLPLGGKPVLDYLLEQLLELDDLAAIHIASNAHYADPFRTWAVGWRQRTDCQLVVHDNGSTTAKDRLGAIGDLDLVLRKTSSPRGALVAAGDNIYRFSLVPFWEAFTRSQRSYVLGLEERDLEKLKRTGVLELDGEDRVRCLHEKPEQPPSHWACPSLYCLQAPALARVSSYLAAGHPRDEIGRFVAHLPTREPLYAHKASGERLHVGSLEAYRRAEDILTGES